MQNKRIIAVFIILVFCAALAIGSSTVFAIAEVNAEYTYISAPQKDKTSDVEDVLSGFEGKNIMLLKQSDIRAALKNFTYLKVERVKKIYPNTLLVAITERFELFAVKQDDFYYMLDKDGFVLSAKQINTNNIDGASNILLNIEASFSVGETAIPADKKMFELLLQSAGIVKNYYADENIRNIIKSAEILEQTALKFTMPQGLSIIIYSAENMLFEKLEAALNFYNDSAQITTEDKAAHNAKIIAFQENDGSIKAHYSTK